MKCDKTTEIVAWLKGEVPEEDRESLRDHFDLCPACSENLARYDRLLKAVGRMDQVEPSPGFAWKVREAFAQQHPRFVEKAQGEPARMTLWQMIRAQFEFVPAWAISAAAHVIFLALGSIIFLSPPDEEEELAKAAVRSKPKASSGNPNWDKPGSSPSGGVAANFAEEEEPVWTSESRPGRDPSIIPDKVPFKGEVDPFKEQYQPRRWVDRLKKDHRVLAYLAPRTNSELKRKLQSEYGGRGVESSIDRALRWLSKTQEKDGSWRVSKNGGKEEYEVGLTGLALLAFLADGHTPQEGTYRNAVSRGLDFLLSTQKSNGLVGSDQGNYLYNHAIGGLVLLEAWLMTRDEKWAAPSASAVAFTMAAQNSTGGWGYRYREETSDTSVAGWQILLLRLAFSAGDKSVIPSLTLAHENMERVTSKDGKVGYKKPGQFPHGYHALTSVGMLSYLLSTHSPDHSRVEQQAELLRDRAAIQDPAGAFENNLYFAYFGSLALLQAENADNWQEWYLPLKKHLLEGQRPAGHWPIAFDKWSGYGGRIYTTAMSVLILEVTWRYPRIFE